jgi:phosphoglycolate phosphatase
MHFKWQNLICDILVTEQKKEKFELIKEKSDIALSKNDWLIGDTGKDIETGKILGIRTIAFTNGFLNDTKLKEYNPTKITASLASIKNIVNE